MICNTAEDPSSDRWQTKQSPPPLTHMIHESRTFRCSHQLSWTSTAFLRHLQSFVSNLSNWPPGLPLSERINPGLKAFLRIFHGSWPISFSKFSRILRITHFWCSKVPRKRYGQTKQVKCSDIPQTETVENLTKALASSVKAQPFHPQGVSRIICNNDVIRVQEETNGPTVNWVTKEDSFLMVLLPSWLTIPPPVS